MHRAKFKITIFKAVGAGYNVDVETAITDPEGKQTVDITPSYTPLDIPAAQLVGLDTVEHRMNEMRIHQRKSMMIEEITFDLTLA